MVIVQIVSLPFGKAPEDRDTKWRRDSERPTLKSGAVRFHELFLTQLGEMVRARPLSCLERSLIVRRVLVIAQLGATNFRVAER